MSPHKNPIPLRKSSRSPSRTARALPLVMAWTMACTGLTFGDNAAGEDTSLEFGAIAVDHLTETAFVMRKTATEGGALKTLWAVPHGGTARAIATLDGQGDIRVSFPESGVLVMAEEDGKEFLTLLDRHTLEVKRTATHKARYHGTRLSPSRRWLAVADNNNKELPLVLINTADLSARRLPGAATWREALWARTSDTLLVLSSDAKDGSTGGLLSGAWAGSRLRGWSMAALEADSFEVGADGFWAAPAVDIALPNHGPDFLFSFTFVAVAPDDSRAVLPMRRLDDAGKPSTYELVEVTLASGAVRTVADAKGPVAFTPDSGTIVSYRDVDVDHDGKLDRQDLLAIDAKSLEVEQLAVPFSGLLNFFVTGEGNFVVVASWAGNAQLSLFDLDTSKSTVLGGPELDLHEVAQRSGELWVCDDALYRLTVGDATLSEVPLPFVPKHLNWLPKADEMVTGGGDKLVYLNAKSGKVLREYQLTAPE